MIPRERRLPSARIDYLFQKGRKTGNEFIVIRYIHSARKDNPSRFCVVISAAVEPKAVNRNRLRRQIYEIIRLNPGPIPPGFDLAIIGRKPIIKLSYNEIASNVMTLLNKLR